MHQTHKYRYAENESLQLLELPYKGGDLTMLVVLPRDPEGLPAVEESLSAGAINHWRGPRFLSGPGLCLVDVYLPKFKLEMSADLKPLDALGMKLAFEETRQRSSRGRFLRHGRSRGFPVPFRRGSQDFPGRD